jgi:sec-independent protein translocase protein TatC
MSTASNDTMPLGEHIKELRSRVIRVFVVFFLMMIVGFFLADPLVEYLRNKPPANHYEWHVFAPMDAIHIYLKVAFFIAFVITSPAILFEIWRFVSPSLKEHERRHVLLYIPVTVGLFLIGASFGYFVLFPLMLQFMFNFAQQLGAAETYGLVQYFNMLLHFVWPVGLVFELPVVIMFLTSVGLLKPSTMRRVRKYAYFAIFVVANVITPPDVITACLVSIPLIALYEISIWLSARIYRNKLETQIA